MLKAGVTPKDEADEAFITKVTKAQYDRSIQLASVYVEAYGPDSTLYGICCDQIIRFTIGSDGEVKVKEPAYTFPSRWWKKYGRT